MKKTIISLVILLTLQLFVPEIAFAQANSGWFLPFVDLWPGSRPEAIAVGDVNSDGRADVVMTTGVGAAATEYSLLVYLQNADGTLADYVALDLPSTTYTSVDIGDVDNLNGNDVIVATSSGIAVFYQDNAGQLGVPVPFGSVGTNKVRVGDFDNDGSGLLDVVAAGGTSIYVFTQSGGTLSDPPTEYSVAHSCEDLQVGDLNNDGYTDIVTMGFTGGTDSIAVFYQDGVGALNDPPTYYTSTIDFNLGCAIGDLDIDNDGLNDLCLAGGIFEPSKVNVFLQNAGGTLDAAVEYDLDEDANGPVVIVDVNRDGRPDPIISHDTSMTVYFQQSDGTLDNRELYDHTYGTWFDPHAMAVGRVDNDTLDDVVYANYNAGLVILYGWNGSDAIVVREPDRNDDIDVNSNFLIQWGVVGTIPDVQIEYSTNGGGSWDVITYSTTNTGFYNWTVPWTESNNYLIRVSDLDGTPMGLSETFSVSDDGVQRVRVLSPNGGETLMAQITHTITWETTGTMDDIRIEYSTDNGDTWTDIINPTENDGSYDWTVPAVSSTECFVRISDANDNDPSDTSDLTFEINPGPDILNLTFPNGGETLPGGQTQTITWTSTGLIPNVKLEFSSDNGTTWNSIVESTGNDGSHAWSVPNIESDECLVRISDALDGSPSDMSTSTFSIVYGGPETLKVTKPNGSNFYLIGTTDYINWTSTGRIDNVRIEYSIDNGASWTEIKASTPNDGTYEWEVPDTPSTQCLVRISDADDGLPYDSSNSVFTIGYPQPAISISSPIGGENWEVGKQHDITWISSGTVGNVKIHYSSNNKNTWKTITNSTANDGSYTWTIPNAPSSQCYVRISEAADSDPTSTNMNPFSIIPGPEDAEISVNRTALYFGSMKLSDVKTPNQKIIVDNNSEVATLRWNAAVNEDAGWLRIDTSSGLNSGMITVSVHPLWLEVGTYTGTITIKDEDANNSPQTVNVTLTVYPHQGDSAPFGTFETPVDGSTVKSSIPVTGWVLDDIGVDKVSIYRNAVPAEGDGMVYVGDAMLVDGARPDVEQLYPSYPASYKAGWGYMMLTNFLPNGGNGTYTLYAYAKDETDHEVLLGSKTITCDNANAVKPFGAIDTPPPGDVATGSSYRNNGWVLTPMPNKVPENGSTILVYIDGVSLGNANYGYYREDIASLFPGYANSNGAHGYFDIDTTAYSNGLHTIQWTAADNAGNADGIGSRYFTIQNSGYNRIASVSTSKKKFRSLSQLVKIPVNRANTVGQKTGYGKGVKPHSADVNKNGTVQVKLRQDNRLELHLFQGKGYRNCDGYLVVGEQLRMLPTGSTLDRKNGIFYWHAGAGFFKKYELMFVLEDASGKITKMPVNVTIVSKY